MQSVPGQPGLQRDPVSKNQRFMAQILITQEDHKFEATLDYMVNSKLAWETQEGPVSKSKNKANMYVAQWKSTGLVTIISNARKSNSKACSNIVNTYSITLNKSDYFMLCFPFTLSHSC